jgi:hypothetical protein
MSAVTISSYQGDTVLPDYDSGVSAVGVARASAGIQSDRVRPLADRTTFDASGSHSAIRDFRVIRKLKGFVAQTEGEKWRVIFVNEGKEIPYDLPAQALQKAGIQARYQPFEMQELESIYSEISGKIYRFRALADFDDVFIETLPLDPERQRKYDLILAHFGKSKD